MRACFLLWRLLERALAISSGVDLLSPFLFLSSHQQSPHLRYAHSWDAQVCRVTIFHMPSQGRAWQESLPQCIWDRDSCPIPPRLFLFPFLCCPLLPVLGIIPAISLSCTPLFRIHSTLESCRVDRSFPSPSQSPAALSHRVFQCPTLTCFTLSASSCSFQSAFCFPLEEPSEAVGLHVCLLAQLTHLPL